LDDQSGGIRTQRISPTEKRNRTHTSTVTVAVMRSDIQVDPRFDMISSEHFRVEWFSGTGAGGQKRNKSQLSCRVIHIPTGLSEARQNRSRNQNETEATEALMATLKRMKETQIHSEMAIDKKDKLGSGQRGDKLITIQFQNDKVTHHGTGKTCRVKDFMNGKMNLLW